MFENHSGPLTLGELGGLLAFIIGFYVVLVGVAKGYRWMRKPRPMTKIDIMIDALASSMTNNKNWEVQSDNQMVLPARSSPAQEKVTVGYNGVHVWYGECREQMIETTGATHRRLKRAVKALQKRWKGMEDAKTVDLVTNRLFPQRTKNACEKCGCTKEDSCA